MELSAEQLPLLAGPLPAGEDRQTTLVVHRGIPEILEQHADWLDSGGAEGMQADFSNEDLENANFIDARLPDAILNKANLKRADLMLADLRGSNLLQADLRDANLLGAQFHQANLQAAILTGATGALSTQFAGANLFGTALPEGVAPSDGLEYVDVMARRTGWLLFLMLIVSALVWLRIFTTRDSELLSNANAIPLPGLQSAAPDIPFYLFGPVVLAGLYIVFHLFLQRLWDGAGQLPAIFSDGKTLDSCLPWFAKWPAQSNCRWLKNTRSPLAFMEGAISVALLYWITPVTILLFWARYLTLQDLRGSCVHVLLFAGSVFAAINFPKMANSAFHGERLDRASAKPTSRNAVDRMLRGVPVGFGLLLAALSVGIATGIPHDSSAKSGNGFVVRSGIPHYKTWASHLLWSFGYNPFAVLTEVNVSTKPPAWSGRDEDYSAVKGANLNRVRMRYAQAYRAFLAKARLWKVDASHADFSESDLREANLRQAKLEFTNFDHANLFRANLQDSDLTKADLNRSDLRASNLSSANLSGATLLDAVLDAANLYKADLRGADLQRATLSQADLREANLEYANLSSAIFQRTYLSSAKLGGAILKNVDLSESLLDDADLSASDLTGAIFHGTVLRGANLIGANLQGADLRGALALTSTQVCSSASFSQTRMDENLALDVEILCGKPH